MTAIRKNHEQEPSAVPASHLRGNALTTRFVLASYSVANIAPMIATIFFIGAIFGVTGIATPFVILWAGAGYLLYMNSACEFARVVPSSGSWVTFLGRSFGPAAGRVAGFAFIILLPLAAGSTLFQLGLWTQTVMAGLFHVNVSWWIPGLVLTVVSAVTVVIGITLSIGTAAILFWFEFIVLLAASIGMIVVNGSHISAAAFNPAHINGGLRGFGLAFPLAVFLCSGADTPNSVAEETEKPRKKLPFAMMAGAIFGLACFVLASFAIGVGFQNNMTALLKPTYPFLTAAARVAPWLGDFVYLAGFTSVMAVVLGGLNMGARVWFSMARDRLLPQSLSRVHPRLKTPWIASIAITAACVAVCFIFDWLSATPLDGWNYCSSIAGIMLIVVLIATNAGLPMLYLREHRNLFSWIRHLVVPILGCLAFLYPLWDSIKPTQPRPYNWFGLGVLFVAACAVIYSVLLKRRGVVSVGGVLAAEETSTADIPALGSGVDSR